MSEDSVNLQGWVCPVPLTHKDKIVLGHGSGGKMTHDLIKTLFWSRFNNDYLQAGNDAAVVTLAHGDQSQDARIAVCTDSHVVSPLFFPGGDIGRLAICGTVNDLSMMGAQPLYLTAGFILEEGFGFVELDTILASMQTAACEAGISIIAGDTKVVQKGKADGLYINTAGFGLIPPHVQISGNNACPGDVVIISGSIGDHGIAVLAARGDLGFETEIQSDVAPLNHLVAAMLASTSGIHVLRDPTRGGLATTLNEIAAQSDVCIQIDETAIFVQPGVAAACEMLGFDPLFVANEGKLVAIVDPDAAPKILSIMQSQPLGKNARVIGQVTASPTKRVLLRTAIGTRRIVDMLAGEMLPRIC